MPEIWNKRDGWLIDWDQILKSCWLQHIWISKVCMFSVWLPNLSLRLESCTHTMKPMERSSSNHKPLACLSTMTTGWSHQVACCQLVVTNMFFGKWNICGDRFHLYRKQNREFDIALTIMFIKHSAIFPSSPSVSQKCNLVHWVISSSGPGLLVYMIFTVM